MTQPLKNAVCGVASVSMADTLVANPARVEDVKSVLRSSFNDAGKSYLKPVSASQPQGLDDVEDMWDNMPV